MYLSTYPSPKIPNFSTSQIFSPPVLATIMLCFIVPVMTPDSHITHELNPTHRATNLNPHWSISTELLKDTLFLLFASMCAKLLPLCLTLCDPRLLHSWDSPGKEYWSGLPCAPPEDLTNPGIKSASLTSPALAGRYYLHSICQIVSHVIHMFIHSIITNK